MGMWGSQNRDGSGQRNGYKENILSEGNMAMGMAGNGETMEIGGIMTDFDVGSIGCSEYGYICSEFTKGVMPEPDFKFEIEGSRPEDEQIFTDCKEQECLASKYCYFFL